MDGLKTLQNITERLIELDNIYLEILTTSGYTANQLLEMFRNGYTLEPPK